MGFIKYQKLECGLQVVSEAINNVQTIGLNWSVPAGVSTNEFDGDSVILSELIQRGSGEYSSKEYNEKLDLLGVGRSASCGIELLRVSGVMLGSVLLDSLPLLGGCILNPALPENDLIPCKNLCLQAIQSLSDNPSQLCSVVLNKQHIPPPFNRSSYGETSCIGSATLGRLNKVHKNSFVPEGSILAVAGKVDHGELVRHIEKLVSKWNGTNSQITEESTPTKGVHWVEQDSSQTHIGIAFDSPNASSENRLLESVAMSVLGGASSGRLFTNVRQRKSLCYSVSAHYSPSKNRSLTRIHAGTTPERASETVNVCLEQLSNLRNGISESEFNRTILRMKSAVVMGGESTIARSGALLRDQYALGRTRSLTELLQEIDGLTHKEVNKWLENRDFGQLTLVTLGPNEVSVDEHLLGVNQS
ncbi:MAG: pitrilysin family protein [Phycisphaerales bacterium]|nr:pitrilysin family protein [Phycisphaerales bacterium]